MGKISDRKEVFEYLEVEPFEIPAFYKDDFAYYKYRLSHVGSKRVALLINMINNTDIYFTKLVQYYLYEHFNTDQLEGFIYNIGHDNDNFRELHGIASQHDFTSENLDKIELLLLQANHTQKTTSWIKTFYDTQINEESEPKAEFNQNLERLLFVKDGLYVAGVYFHYLEVKDGINLNSAIKTQFEIKDLSEPYKQFHSYDHGLDLAYSNMLFSTKYKINREPVMTKSQHAKELKKESDKQYDQAKEFARTIATNNWSEDDTQKYGQIAKYIIDTFKERQEEFNYKTPVDIETVKRWIKDLAPNDACLKGGRPKKT